MISQEEYYEFIDDLVEFIHIQWMGEADRKLNSDELMDLRSVLDKYFGEKWEEEEDAE